MEGHKPQPPVIVQPSPRRDSAMTCWHKRTNTSCTVSSRCQQLKKHTRPDRLGVETRVAHGNDRRSTVMTLSSLRIALYARVSSQQQAEANTIASQVEALQARIHADGLRVEAEACFLDEGYSGSTLLRPALERFRDQAAAGALDRLYVHSPDRLARNYALQVLLLDEWQRAGVEVLFLNRPIGKSPEEDLLLQVQGMMAEYERAKILERSRRGKRHAARAASVNVLCGAVLWLPLHRQARRWRPRPLQIHEEHARVVRLIFTWVGLERCSIGEVCPACRPKRFPARRANPTGTARRLGNPEESGLQGAGSIRQDARGSASSPFTTFTREKGAIPPNRRRLRHGQDRPHCHRGSRPSRREPVRGRGRTTPGESATLPHAWSGRLLFAARLAGLRDVWLCLLRQARQPSLAERPDATTLTTAVGGPMRIGSVVSGCAATDRAARICWTKPCGTMLAPCWRIRSECVASTSVGVGVRTETEVARAIKSAS